MFPNFDSPVVYLSLIIKEKTKKNPPREMCFLVTLALHFNKETYRFMIMSPADTRWRPTTPTLKKKKLTVNVIRPAD